MTRNQKGFSFLETMIAMVILMVGMMGLAIAFQRSISQTNASKNDAVAMTLASGIVDNLESRPFDDWDNNADLAVIAQDFYADFQGNYLTGAPDDAYFKPKAEIIQDYSTHRDVRITVDWGGLEEMKKAGFINSAATNTFVMDVTLSQSYGADVFDTETGSP